MMRRLPFFSLLISAGVLIGTAQAAGFDCQKAKTPTEKAICKNEPLSKADEQLASQYAALLKALPKDAIETFKQAQLNWVKERNACGADVACLNRVYSGRNKVLAARLEQLSQTQGAKDKTVNEAEMIVYAEYYLRGKYDLWDAELRVLDVTQETDKVRVELAAQGKSYALDVAKESGRIVGERLLTP